MLQTVHARCQRPDHGLERTGRGGSRRWAIAAALTLAGAALGPQAASHAAEATTRNVGAWSLKLQGSDRQCWLTLRAAVALSGYAVAMPAGCHRAFPVLKSVALWTDTGEGKLQLDDAAGQPVLAFEPGPEGVLTGTSPQGEIYLLEPGGVHKDTILPGGTAPLPAAVQSAQAAPAQVAPAAEGAVARLQPPRPAEMAGYFSVLREKTRDTGCMVTFDDKTRGPKGSFKAHLAPACRDQGIIIFDPVGWQLAGSRLVLTARKGHTANFDLQPDGSWLKDPAEGKSLSLKKM